jgi:hypothetical protein
MEAERKKRLSKQEKKKLKVARTVELKRVKREKKRESKKEKRKEMLLSMSVGKRLHRGTEGIHPRRTSPR